MKNTAPLSSKIALITGASGGIGGAIARHLHSRGAIVVLSGTRAALLESLAESLGERAHVVPANLSDTEAVQKLYREACSCAGGSIDWLICNAGITRDGLTMRMDESMFEEVLRVNLTAAFTLSRLALKDMFKQRYGRIVYISSIVASMGNPGQANYAASKGALEAMARSLAIESATRNVTVNAVAPGFIHTDMTAGLNDAQKEAILSRIPSKTMGEPEDVAEAVGYLVSDGARYVTGHTLHINGGLYMA